jgi:uncharacterized repeat protein (TIGR03806 family)
MEEPFPEKLSDWNLYIGKLSDLKPNQGVIPYELNMPLFTDYASKSRFIWMPQGKSAEYKEEDTFVFPLGTIISKTFYFQGASIGDSAVPHKLIETRLLINTSNGWVALPYIWDKDLQEARLEITGGKQNLTYQDSGGASHKLNYIIPNTNQCKGCHENQKQIQPIGPKAKNLNKTFAYADGTENQLIKWKQVGYLSGLPEDIKKVKAFPSLTSTDISDRARGYLDVNCGHCHNPTGPANTSGLMLNYTETDRKKIGFCKTPVASGKGSGNLLYDIVPSKPNESILLHRMISNEPDIMMPELGRSVIHEEGVELIRKWIESEKGSCI